MVDTKSVKAYFYNHFDCEHYSEEIIGAGKK